MELRRPNLERILTSYDSRGILPQFFVEDVAAVHYSARNAGLCRYGARGNHRELKKSDNFRWIRKHVEKDFGIDATLVMQPPLLSTTAHPCLSFYRGKKTLNEILGINEKFRSGSLAANNEYFEAVRAEGLLLGFPACCIDLYVAEKSEAAENAKAEFGNVRIPVVENPDQLTTEQRNVSRMLGTTERRARRQLSDTIGKKVEDRNMSPLEFGKLPLDLLSVYFAFEFYPCKPDCNKAKQVGERILSAFQEGSGDLYDIYRRIILPTNAYRVWSDYHPLPILQLSRIRTTGFLRGHENLS